MFVWTVTVVKNENAAYLCIYDQLGYCKTNWLISAMMYIVIFVLKIKVDDCHLREIFRFEVFLAFDLLLFLVEITGCQLMNAKHRMIWN